MVFYATIMHCEAMLETAWANEMNVMNHAPGTGSIARPVDQLIAREKNVGTTLYLGNGWDT